MHQFRLSMEYIILDMLREINNENRKVVIVIGMNYIDDY